MQTFAWLDPLASVWFRSYILEGKFNAAEYDTGLTWKALQLSTSKIGYADLSPAVQHQCLSEWQHTGFIMQHTKRNTNTGWARAESDKDVDRSIGEEAKRSARPPDKHESWLRKRFALCRRKMFPTPEARLLQTAEGKVLAANVRMEVGASIWLVEGHIHLLGLCLVSGTAVPFICGPGVNLPASFRETFPEPCLYWQIIQGLLPCHKLDPSMDPIHGCGSSTQSLRLASPYILSYFDKDNTLFSWSFCRLFKLKPQTSRSNQRESFLWAEKNFFRVVQGGVLEIESFIRK